MKATMTLDDDRTCFDDDVGDDSNNGIHHPDDSCGSPDFFL